MLPAAEGSRPVIIIAMTYLVGLGGFAHVIAGSVEVLYAVVTTGAVTWSDYFCHFLLPALGGNIIGGVSLVALFNHAQVVTEHNESSDYSHSPRWRRVQDMKDRRRRFQDYQLAGSIANTG